MYLKLRQREGDNRADELILAEAKSIIKKLQDRGLDIGFGHDGEYRTPESLQKRLHVLYDNAKEVINKTLSPEFDKVAVGDSSIRTIGRL